MTERNARTCMWISTGMLGFVFASLVGLAACSQRPGTSSNGNGASPVSTTPGTTAAEINPRLLRRFRPLGARFEDPHRPPPNAAVIELGRRLFYERGLSANGKTSCDTCHSLQAYGVDHLPVSLGDGGLLGRRNAPTVYNAAGSFVQFWDGRAPDVEGQATGPILNPIEMGLHDPAEIVARLRATPSYEAAFRKAFPADPNPVTSDNVSTAIGAFERGLVTPGRWDRYLEGDVTALSAKEKEGLKTFVNVGCMVCHTGPLLGGSMFERAGVVEPWPNGNDHGRAEVTHDAADDMMFKVPTLRNVAETAPYFHDGSASTLPGAIAMMGRHQLGLELTEPEVASIAAWMTSLTGDLPTAYLEPSAEVAGQP
jgi:cytochrome c peroxidase